MKKLFLSGLVFGILLVASTAFANWGNYYVKAAGPYQTTNAALGEMILIKLDPAPGTPGAEAYFRLKPERENEFLAIALTALSTGSPVRAFIQQLFSNNHWSDFVVTTMFVGETLTDLQ